MAQLRFFDDTKKKESKICAFTGHRQLGADFSARRLKEAIVAQIESGVEIFLSGMAIGFDLLAAETVLSLKENYPHIKLVACIPCYGQEKYFSQEDKERYVEACAKSDEKILLSQNYYRGCMQKRDRYMAERADVMIAYCKKSEGGTAYTVRYFRSIHPENEIVFL